MEHRHNYRHEIRMGATDDHLYGPVVRDRSAIDRFFRGSTEVVDGLLVAVETQRFDQMRGLMHSLYEDAERTGLASVAEACRRIEQVCDETSPPAPSTPSVLVERVDDLFAALGDALDDHLEHQLGQGMTP